MAKWLRAQIFHYHNRSIISPLFWCGSSPTGGTCRTRLVLLAGVPGVLISLGVLPFLAHLSRRLTGELIG